ncbi:acid phosphatase [Sphingomonas lacunae]|uniref:5'-nucleotidase n=1 Tax=Sphingomonas lacunae TaxID=2698828 RepID=A0A6M4AU30_9SPHN|nr:5'/3'-nucleotidase SurE [Sphingomonas lacunae]QJQ32585.1 acid phosphatase [Sphingomonas lacunae]
MLMFAGAVALGAAAPAEARNIVLTNDDGLTANVKALYDRLKAEGHDVIVAVPCSQQSGMGGAMRFLRPIAPLTENCANDAAEVGAPGAGPMTRPGLGPDFYYVAGTPVMAMLYGIDVVAQSRWGGPPDIVLSGPNIGQNAGSIVISSGTVSNAQFAMIRDIPAIALSAGEHTASGADLVNPQSVEVATLTVRLLDQLELSSGGGRLLPSGVALNVNFPDQLANARWRMSRIGSYIRYDVRFVTDMRRPNPNGEQEGPAQPGVAIGRSNREPGPGQADNEAAIVESDIAVSVMQLAYDAPEETRQLMGQTLDTLIDN